MPIIAPSPDTARSDRLPAGQVVRQQPPGVFCAHRQAGDCAGSWLVVEAPASSGGHEMPGLGDRARDGKRHGVARLRKPGPAGRGRPSAARRAPARPGRRADRWGGPAPGGAAAGDPVLRQLAGLVEPGRHRAGPADSTPRRCVHAGFPARKRPAICGPVHCSRSVISRGLGPARCADPFGLHLIEPGHEPALRRGRAGGGVPVVAVAVPGQQPEVITEQMGAQSEDAPARARRRPLPVRLMQAEQVIQPVRSQRRIGRHSLCGAGGRRRLSGQVRH